MGGLAVWLTSPSARRPPFERPYADLDFAAAKRAAREVKAFFEARGQVERMLNEIARAPKSLAWKARARLGERVRWYETPEEVRH